MLTGINGVGVQSDEIGNITNDGTWTYTWKNGRQLATMSKSGTTWNFFYDASGMRTQRTNGSTTYTYTYDGGKLTQMKMGSTTMRFTYGINGHPVSLNYDGTVYYYVTNAQGDVVGILNSSGQEVVTYAYDAWGNILSTTGTMAGTLGAHNPLRYRGYVYDRETGLYYLQSRYYNPTIGRFISADSFVSTGKGILSYNMFAYCLNNPVNLSDCTGNIPTRKNTVAINDGGSGTSSLDLQALYAIMNKFSNSGFDFSNSISLRVTEFDINVNISSLELALMGKNAGVVFVDAGVAIAGKSSKRAGIIAGAAGFAIGAFLKYVHYYNRPELPNGDYKVYVIDSITSSAVYYNGASGCWNKTYFHTVTVIYEAINIEGGYLKYADHKILIYTEQVF